jgi:aldehyde:ferredoxin oxidoreductase
MGFIDLASGETTYEPMPDELVRNYLGGYGLGAYILMHRQPAGVDPLGADALLGFTTGPLTGTDAITGNRFTVVGKSPKTGGWGDANCGGDFGPAMKMSGFDHVFFKGIADEPVVIVLEGGKAETKPAGDLWGLGCIETEERLKETYGKKANVACIGPAGERVSLLACVINDKGRAAGRSGLGAVMGAKKIKAIVAVATDKVPAADAEGLKNLRKDIVASYKQDNPGYDLFSKYGTAGVTANTVLMGDGPIKNWAGTVEEFPGIEKISDDSVFGIQVRPYGCWRCPVACGGHVKVPEGPLAGIEGHKPEYETLAAFGSMCLNDDLATIVKANNLCNDYGMDTIAAGTTVAYAFELYDRGLVSSEDLGGLELTWGNGEAVVALTEQLATGEGPGAKLFGDGMKAAAERIGKGSEAFAMHAAGEELPMHDPRCKPGLGASYVIDATPGRHTQWSSWNVEDGFVPAGLNPPPIEDKYVYSGKGKSHYIMSNFGHCVNMAGVCWFATSIGPAEGLPKALSLATGMKFEMADMQEIGARAAALRQAFNFREGFKSLEVKLPDRVLGKPPLGAGPTKDVTVDNEQEIRDYMEVAGWNQSNGCPSEATLRRLGLDFVLDVIGDEARAG